MARPGIRPVQRLAPFAWVWAGIAAGIALPAISSSTPDSRVVVAAASIILPAAAAAAGLALRYRRVGLACGLLALSVGTPTYFAYMVNLIPIGIIIATVVDARRSPRDPNEPPASGPTNDQPAVGRVLQ